LSSTIPERSLAPDLAPMSVRWLGHATALIELDGIRLLTDPVLRPRVGPLVRIAAPVGETATGPVDCVLLSHLHADHVDLPSLRSIGESVPVIAPHPAAAWLRRAGLSAVQELRPDQEVSVRGLRIAATPARHDRRRGPWGPAAEPIGYVIGGTRSAYFPGDTDLFAAMASLRGAIDLALLPVWGWGRRLGEGHLDPERAARAAALIAPRVAIPIHWGTFALGRPLPRPPDPNWPARRFAALAADYAPGVAVRVLAPGERTEL
jgi:L-ascorbate metabolism protein UlaG (beta-lactamase superfamily)